MAQFVNMFEVDLDKRSYPVNLNQTVSEGNVSSNRIGAYVYRDGAAVNLGGNCTGMVMRADGSTVPLTGVIDGNAAYVVLDQPSCAIPGPIQVAVNWVSGSNTTTLLVAYGTVIQTNTRDYVQPGTPIPDINELLAEIDEMREATADAEAAATKSVRYDESQTLTDTQKATARGNIDAASVNVVNPLYFSSNDHYTVEAGDNLNDLVTLGAKYVVPTTSVAQNAINCPSVYAGKLIPYQPAYGTGLCQLYMDVEGGYYQRAYVSGSWTGWYCLSGEGKILASADNFNSITSIGKYVVGSQAVAKAITNCPSTYAGVLDVSYTSSKGSNVRQIYIDATGNVFIRAYALGAWTKWFNDRTTYVYKDEFKDRTLVFSGGYIVTNTNVIDYSSVNGDNNYVNSVCDCTEGDLFAINGAGAVAARLYAFCDTAGNSLLVSGDTYTTNGKYIVIKAPAGATKVIFNCKTESEYKACKFGTDPSVKDIELSYLQAEDFGFGLYLVDGSFMLAYDYICTKEYLPDFYQSFTVVDDDIKVAIVVFEKSGAMHSRNFWYRKNDKFIFNHELYNYKMYLAHESNGANTVLGDWDKLLEKVALVANKDISIERIRSLRQENAEKDAYINEIARTLQSIKGNTEYNISYSNTIRPLQFMNYSGDNQNIHPKVLYIESGFAGHTYWMAYTPYTLGRSEVENPCIAYSDDGIAWTNIPGNPIDTPSNNAYLSDTHLVMNGSTMECWYRLASDPEVSPRDEIIYRKTSTDGITWSARQQMLSVSNNAAVYVMSPSIIIENNKYCMWSVNAGSSNGVIQYREAPVSNPQSWSTPRDLQITWGSANNKTLYPWHMDIIKDNGQYVLCAMCRTGMTSSDTWLLMLTTSTDNTTYSAPYIVIKGSVDGWDKYIYRSSIVNVLGKYRIYYTGLNGKNAAQVSQGANWHMGITESNALQNFIGMVY